MNVRMISHHGFVTGLLLLSGMNSAAVAADLKYDIKPDDLIAYKVEIQATTGSTKDRMTGTFAVKGKSANDDQLSVTYVGGLSRSRTTSRPRGFRGGFRGPGGPPRPSLPSIFGGVSMGGLTRSTNQLVVTRKGQIKKLEGQSQVPYLIGNVCLLPFEMLPKDGKTEWEWGTGISVTEEEESDFPFGPFRGQTTVKVGGSESTKYKISGEDGDLVTIATTYKLNSPAANKDDEAVEIDGTGTLVFNQKDGVVESHKMKRTYVSSNGGTKVTFPLTISITRMPRETYEQQEKERAERIAEMQRKTAEKNAKAAAAAKEAAGKKLDPEKKKQIMADLNSSHWPAVQKRVQALSRFHPHPDDFDVALKIKELRKHKVVGVYLHARRLWDKLEPIVEEGQKQMAAETATTADVGNPFATKEEKKDASLRAMREWKSGKYSVKAQFVKFDDSAIVLKREDGKEITVPVEKLSEADQKVAEILRKESEASKKTAEDNPFE